MVKATATNGTTVDLAISGNITSSQISKVTLTTNQSVTTTTVSFVVAGEKGTTGFSNITIPKSSVPFGGFPTIYIDKQSCQNQGYVQDSSNYYVWYTTHFSTHQVTIQFAIPSKSISTPLIQPFIAVGITVPEIILVYAIIAVQRLRRKPENAT